MIDSDMPKLIKKPHGRLRLIRERFAQRDGVGFNYPTHWEIGERSPWLFMIRRYEETSNELSVAAPHVSILRRPWQSR